jgi:hypothetical protein
MDDCNGGRKKSELKIYMTHHYGELIFDFVSVGLPTIILCIRLVDNKMTDSTQNKVSYLLPYNMVLSFIFVSQKLEKYSGPSSIVGC